MKKFIAALLICILLIPLSLQAQTVNRDPYGRAMPKLYDYSDGVISDFYLDFPTLSADDIFCGLTTTQTLTNKILTSPTLTDPTVTTGQFTDPNISSSTITSSTITSSTLTDPIVTTGQFTDPNLSSATIDNSIITDPTIHDPNIINIPIFAQTGKLKLFTYQADSLADDGTISLPDATDGVVFASCTDPNTPATVASGSWVVVSDGSVSKIGGTSNTDAYDYDGNFVIYDGGTNAVVKNRLGAIGTTRVFYFFQ